MVANDLLFHGTIHKLYTTFQFSDRIQEIDRK